MAFSFGFWWFWLGEKTRAGADMLRGVEVFSLGCLLLFEKPTWLSGPRSVCQLLSCSAFPWVCFLGAVCGFGFVFLQLCRESFEPKKKSGGSFVELLCLLALCLGVVIESSDHGVY